MSVPLPPLTPAYQLIHLFCVRAGAPPEEFQNGLIRVPVRLADRLRDADANNTPGVHWNAIYQAGQELPAEADDDEGFYAAERAIRDLMQGVDAYRFGVIDYGEAISQGLIALA